MSQTNLKLNKDPIQFAVNMSFPFTSFNPLNHVLLMAIHCTEDLQLVQYVRIDLCKEIIFTKSNFIIK